jgi:hypothetical protein
MATVLRGKRKGETVTLHQWANDWFTVDHADGSPAVAGPTSIQLDEAEIARWRARPNGMDRRFTLSDNGRFVRRQS